MNRDELIEAGVRVIVKKRPLTTAEAMDAILDAVEPLIRADERERFDLAVGAVALNEELADLRAKVEALTTEYDSAVDDYISRADVLALFDGGSDD